jgi:hypothetical protein
VTQPNAAAPSGRIRGSILVHLRAHVEAKHAAAGWARVVAGVPPADRDPLGALLISGAWYPVGLWNRAWLAYLASSGGDPAAEMGALAVRVADADLHTVFKLTLKLASAAQIVRRADWLWSRYFDEGTVTVTEDAPSHFRVRLESPTGEDAGPNQAICAHGVPRWLMHALQLSGAAKATVEHTRCRFTFSKYCEYRVAW